MGESIASPTYYMLRAMQLLTRSSPDGGISPQASEADDAKLALFLLRWRQGRRWNPAGRRPIGLSRTAYYLLLMAAGGADPGGVRAADLLAACTAPRRIGARAILRQCVARGLLMLDPDGAKRRRQRSARESRRVTLTPRGRALLARLVRDEIAAFRRSLQSADAERGGAADPESGAGRR